MVLGDIVLAVNGVPAGSLENMIKVKDQLSVAPAGAPLKITILRSRHVLELNAKVP
jgi:hypothetical protein